MNVVGLDAAWHRATSAMLREGCVFFRNLSGGPLGVRRGARLA